MQVIIIGAGISGLTLASKLLENNIKTIIIERENAVGGLARSFNYPNKTIFDIGPHRFHTDDKFVEEFINDVLKEDQIIIPRKSQLYLFEKYLPWPITFKSIFSLPLKLLVLSSCDLLKTNRAKSESLEDYIIEKYGKTLYKTFFKPYTEKFVDYTCQNMHRDWAITGINRATIDKKVNTTSLSGLIKSVITTNQNSTRFIYPKTGGINLFSIKLAERIKRMGGEILTLTTVKKLTRGNGGQIKSIITDKNEEIRSDHIFWSGTLNSLRDIGQAPETLPKLHYMSSIFFNYLSDNQVDHNFQWCYFGGKEAIFDRVSMPRFFNPICAPRGKEALCVEICCLKGSRLWENPTREDCNIETFLNRVGLLKNFDDVIQLNIEKVQETYPLYTLNYPRKLKLNFKWVNESMPNLTLIGRTGRFWYNNMDHSIAAALEVARRFIEDYENGDIGSGDIYSVENRYLGG